MNKEEYEAYLLGTAWKIRRSEAVLRAGGRCQLCNGKVLLQVHHRTYKRVGRELPEDLTVLCERCHEKYHTKEERERERND